MTEKELTRRLDMVNDTLLIMRNELRAEIENSGVKVYTSTSFDKRVLRKLNAMLAVMNI